MQKLLYFIKYNIITYLKDALFDLRLILIRYYATYYTTYNAITMQYTMQHKKL